MVDTSRSGRSAPNQVIPFIKTCDQHLAEVDRPDAILDLIESHVSKWNKIEHRLFSRIALNWRGKPLVNLVTIVNLIGDTTTEVGLRIRSEIDRGRYPMGVVITDQQMARIRLEPHTFHGDWNYTIRPRSRHH